MMDEPILLSPIVVVIVVVDVTMKNEKNVTVCGRVSEKTFCDKSENCFKLQVSIT